jgi:outer membrane protein OmpA-like peptidoglycan-associated protein
MRVHLLAVVLAASCGGAVTFEGRDTLTITGTPVAKAPVARVEVKETKIEIRDKIQFEYNKAVISQTSFELMDEIAAVIKDHPELKKIRIEGHASADGNPRWNKKLSAQRANAVMHYLVDHGVSADELTAQGFGSERPIADNATADGREQNRRVEFTILDPSADTTASTETAGKRGAP